MDSTNNEAEADELISDFESLKLSALTNAARISSYNLDCTLGAGRETNSKALKKESLNKTLDLRITIQQNDKLKSQLNENFDNYSSRTIEILDYEALSYRVKLKNAEKQRKEQNQKELALRQIRFQKEDQKRQQFNQQIRDKARQELVVRKIENDKRIVEQIEQNTNNNEETNKLAFEKIKNEQSRKIKKMACEAICKYQMKFRNVFERIAKQLQAIDKTLFTKAEEFNKSLRTLKDNFEDLIKKVKNDEIGMNEVKTAENLCSVIENLENLLESAIEKLNADLVAKKSSEMKPKPVEPLVVQLVEQPAQNNVEAPIATPAEEKEVVDSKPNYEQNPLASFVSAESLVFYNNIMAFYQNKVDSIKPLQADENMKKYRTSCQKAVNIPVNAISAVTPQHLQDKYDKLFSLLSGAPVKTVDGSVISINDHPLGRDFCLLLLAKKFVGQGDTMISSNLQAAFPMASVIVSIWQKIPELGTLFLAYTFKECPYLVPYFIPQYNGQSIEDYSKVIGYRIVNGALEAQDMYLKRQSGIVRLYSAIMITDPRQIDGPHHPYGLDNGWKWLCNLINLDPLPDICPTVILEFLQISGSNMWRTYGVQFEKILRLIQHQYIQKLAKVDAGGPKSRLEKFLMDVLKTRQIEQPEGVLPPNFW